MYLQYDINFTRNQKSDFSFSTRDVHVASYDESWHSTFHEHPFTELIYVLEGTGKLLTQQTSYSLKALDLVIINPHIVHTEMSSQDEGLKYVVIGMGGVTAFDDKQYHKNIFMMTDYTRQYRDYIEMIMQELENPQPYTNEMVHNLVSNIILKLQNEINDFTVHMATNTTLSSIVYQAKYYIDQHFMSALSLDTLAAVTHVSKYHLAHIFKEEMGVTINQHINYVRMERAKELLERTNYSIHQIATLTGFSSHSYFSTKFTQMFNQTPIEYRNWVQQHS